MNSTIILKGNILYTPRPSEFVAIQQGYVIAVDGVVVHCGESIPPAYGEHPITDYGDHLIIPRFVGYSCSCTAILQSRFRYG